MSHRWVYNRLNERNSEVPRWWRIRLLLRSGTLIFHVIGFTNYQIIVIRLILRFYIFILRFYIFLSYTHFMGYDI